MTFPSHRYYCMFDQIRDPKSLTAVELGFASLGRATVFSEMFASYEAVDIAATRLVAETDVQFSFRDADLNDDWPFGDQKIDVVIAMMIFEHLFDPFHSFKELARILKPGGLAFVNLPNIGSIRCRLDLLRGRLPVTSSQDWFQIRQWDGGHLHYFTRDVVCRLGELYGLRLKRTYPVGRLVGLKRLWPTMLCHELSYVFCKSQRAVSAPFGQG